MSDRTGRIPNFFIVGAPRCGTSSMFYYLSEHPDIHMPPPARKEPHHFCPDIEHRGAVRDADAYRELFAEAGPARAVGEASVFYLYSEQAPELIHRHNPDARIIILLRDPVDFMFSLHKLNTLVNGETENFEQALALEADRLEGRHLPEDRFITPSLHYRRLARFAPHVRRYQEAFGHDRVKVVFLEDMKADIAGVYRQLLEFLDVDPEFRAHFAVYNASDTFNLRRTLRRFPRLHLLLVRAIPTKWRHRLGRMILPKSTGGARAEVPEDLRARLLAELAPATSELADLTGRNLAHWGALARTA